MLKADYQGAVRHWMGQISEETHIAVTLTMKQSACHQKLDTYLASKNMRHFLNKLNRAVYGNAAKRFGKRLDVLSAQEVSNWQRLHYHLLIKVPDRMSKDELTDSVLLHWKSTDFAYNENIIKSCYSPGWINYMLKNFGRISELDIENTHISR